MSSPGRIAAVVAYPSKHPETGEALKFDMDYYLASHMPLIERAWGPYGLKSWSINTFTDPCPISGAKPPYSVQTTCIFDSLADFKNALEKGSKESGPDVDNFSNVFPAIWVGETGGNNVLGGISERA